MPAGRDERPETLALNASDVQSAQDRPLRLLVCGSSDGRSAVLALLGASSQGSQVGLATDRSTPAEPMRAGGLGRECLVTELACGCRFDAADLGAAASADAAILAFDPEDGMDDSARLHASVLSLLAVPALVLAARHKDADEPPARLSARILDAFQAGTVGMALPEAASILLPSRMDDTPAAADRSGEDRLSTLAAQLERLPMRAAPAISTGNDDEAASAPDDEHLPIAADQFSVKILWLDAAPMVPGRDYVLGANAQDVPLTVTTLRYRLDPASGARESAAVLGEGEVGVCNLSLGRPLALMPFADAPAAGCFVVRSRPAADGAGATLGLGTVRFPLRRATNVQWQALDVTKAVRAAAKGQKPAVLWLTGLSGSGKSTIANRLERRLHRLGRHTYLLDGDNVRHGLNRDLGFTEVDRVENIRRIAEVARLFADAGLIVVVSFISPFRSERRMARELMPAGEFVEIFVDTPIEECARRDPKGLYEKARRGEIKNFTGIDSPYEPPLDPDLRLATLDATPDELVAIVEEHLRDMGIIV